MARRFFRERGFKHVALLSADGALEAAPAMGSADIILDLVSTGEHWQHYHPSPSSPLSLDSVSLYVTPAVTLRSSNWWS